MTGLSELGEMGERVVGHLEGLICETGLIHQLPCPCEIRREQEESDAHLRRGRGRGWWSNPSQELRGEQALSILRKVLGSRRLEREGIDLHDCHESREQRPTMQAKEAARSTLQAPNRNTVSYLSAQSFQFLSSALN